MDTSPDSAEIASRAQRIVKALAREHPSRSGLFPDRLESAARFIEAEMGALGYNVESQMYESDGTDVRNLVAEHPGSDAGASSIVLGAHYDTVPETPGADDNASGIAGLLELARLLKDSATKRTVKFAAFANEEPPYFYTERMGSRQYAKMLRRQKADVLLMFSLEMIGYTDEARDQTYPFPLMRQLLGYPKIGNFIALVGNLRTTGLVRVVREAMRRGCKVGVESLSAPGFLPPLFLSDHSSFWHYRYPALMVTDTAFLRNPHYHLPTDTDSTINYKFLAEVVSGVYSAVLALDGLP